MRFGLSGARGKRHAEAISIKLHQLHAVLLWTMGWARGHLREFVIGHDHYGEPDPNFDTPPRVQREERFTLAATLGARKSFIYLYDTATAGNIG